MKVRKDGIPETIPISATSLPLPTGAATSANQLPDGHNVTIDNGSGASAVNIQDGGNSITIDGTISATQSGVWNINDISGTVSLPTGASTSANQQTDALTDTELRASAVPIEGDVANDTADSGDPLKIGGVARTTNPTAVADSDRVNAIFDKIGRQIITLHAPRELTITDTLNLTDTTETTLLATGGAGVFHDLIMLVISNASNVSTRVDIRDDTGGTVILPVEIASKGGAVIPFPTTLAQTAVNDNWTAQLSDGDADIRIFVQAVKNI